MNNVAATCRILFSGWGNLPLRGQASWYSEDPATLPPRVAVERKHAPYIATVSYHGPPSLGGARRVARVYLKSWRTGWPWLLTSVFFLLDGYVQFLVAQADRTTALTVFVASIGRAPGFVLGLTIFAILLGVAWRIGPAQRTHRGVSSSGVSTG